MSETNLSLAKYRDILESIVNCTMEHVDQALRPGTNGGCTCASSSPITAGADGSKSCFEFHKLGRMFTRMKFEFPPQSYPEYTADFDRDERNNVPAESDLQRAAADSLAAGTLSPAAGLHHGQLDFLHPYSITNPLLPEHVYDTEHFLMPDLWDRARLDGVAGTSSNKDQFIQHMMDGFLPR